MRAFGTFEGHLHLHIGDEVWKDGEHAGACVALDQGVPRLHVWRVAHLLQDVMWTV